jgi:hypothetical protein
MATLIQDVEEERKKVFAEMTKNRMQEIGLSFTDEQVEQMSDFVNGIISVTLAIQRDCICERIRELK